MSQQINLYNPLFLRKEKLFSARAMAQALALVGFGLMAIFAYSAWQTRDAERISKGYGEQVAAQREQLVQLSAKLAPQGRSKALEAEVAKLEATVKGRNDMLALLTTGQLGNSEGISRYFAAFGRQGTPGVWLTGFTIGEGGNDMRLNGRVVHPDMVPAYLRALNREPVMRGRQVTELKLTAKSPADATAAQGAKPAPGAATAPAASAEPTSYVEFSIQAPLRAPEPDKASTKGDKP